MIGHRISIEAQNTSQATTVSSDWVSRLQYYLSCVDSVCEFGVPPELKDHRNPRFNSKLLGPLIEVSLMLDPQLMVRAGVFIQDESKSTNEFYNINTRVTSALATDTFIVGGRQVRKKKIMTFTNRSVTSVCASQLAAVVDVVHHRFRLPCVQLDRE